VDKLAKTYVTKEKDISRSWYVVDAQGQTLGRLASRVAAMLMGKHKPIFTCNLDVGDHVIVINASKVVLTGQKLEEKKYYHHSGYPGGFKEETHRDLMVRKPEFVVEKAIKNMLPHNKLGRQMYRKLKVYAGSDHPHQAQKPIPLKI
jgi:large subunit ribosomal protein L13